MVCVARSFHQGCGTKFHLLGLSEEQISELFSSAGQVLNFRLVYDRDTGRPKGFGFAEYPDAGTDKLILYYPHINNPLTQPSSLRLSSLCCAQLERPRDHGSQITRRL